MFFLIPKHHKKQNKKKQKIKNVSADKKDLVIWCILPFQRTKKNLSSGVFYCFSGQKRSCHLVYFNVSTDKKDLVIWCILQFQRTKKDLVIWCILLFQRTKKILSSGVFYRFNGQKRSCHLVYFTVSADKKELVIWCILPFQRTKKILSSGVFYRFSGQKSKNKRKRNDKQILGPSQRTKKVWNMRVTVIPNVVGALGTVFKKHRKKQVE